MQAQDPDELLEMVVEDRVVHSHIHILNRVCDDTVPGNGVRLQFDPCRLAQRLWMNTDTAKVPDDKTEDARCIRIRGYAYQGVLWMCLKPDSIDEQRRKERREEDSNETRR